MSVGGIYRQFGKGYPIRNATHQPATHLRHKEHAERYETSMPQLEKRWTELESRIKNHLATGGFYFWKMNNYNPNIHHRRSIRLKGYDYSKAGLYFITICCQDRICRFGDIENDEMQLNEYGKIAYLEWMKLPERFPVLNWMYFK